MQTHLFFSKQPVEALTNLNPTAHFLPEKIEKVTTVFSKLSFSCAVNITDAPNQKFELPAFHLEDDNGFHLEGGTIIDEKHNRNTIEKAIKESDIAEYFSASNESNKLVFKASVLAAINLEELTEIKTTLAEAAHQKALTEHEKSKDYTDYIQALKAYEQAKSNNKAAWANHRAVLKQNADALKKYEKDMKAFNEQLITNEAKAEEKNKMHQAEYQKKLAQYNEELAQYKKPTILNRFGRKITPPQPPKLPQVVTVSRAFIAKKPTEPTLITPIQPGIFKQKEPTAPIKPEKPSPENYEAEAHLQGLQTKGIVLRIESILPNENTANLTHNLATVELRYKNLTMN